MSCQIPENIKRKRGFTLIEVLIVLVIISIMAGLLLTVIDPAKQRDRARDGAIIATTNKIVAAIQSYFSATGTYPTCLILAGSGTANEIQNVSTVSGDLNACTAGSGSFVINNLTTPDLCAASTGYGTGTSKCKFRYGSTGTAACLGIRLHLATNIDNDATSGTSLIWTSATGAIKDETGASCTL